MFQNDNRVRFINYRIIYFSRHARRHLEVLSFSQHLTRIKILEPVTFIGKSLPKGLEWFTIGLFRKRLEQPNMRVKVFIKLKRNLQVSIFILGSDL